MRRYNYNIINYERCRVMRKLFKKIATVVAAVAMVTAMTTTAFAAEDTYNVAGAAGLCGEDWKVDGNQMEKQADGTWAKEFKDIKAGTYEFKVALNGKWDKSYNLEGEAEGYSNASVKVEKDGSTVIVTFDGTKAGVTVKAPGAADAPAADKAPVSKEEAPKTGETTAVVAMLAVAAVAGAMVVASRKQTVNN